MGVEIDFLPVGEETKSGDAIAIRYGNLMGGRSEQVVVIIDGGFSANGAELVNHIKNRYGTDIVDLVISTHPDQDHVSGLSVVMEQLDVRELWMHRPWLHSASASAGCRVGFSKMNLPQMLIASLQQASDLETIAAELGIPIREPFEGVASADGAMRVVGPSKSFYDEMLSEAEAYVPKATTIADLFRKAAAMVFESVSVETLTDDGETTALNNTSAITLLEIDGRRYLFTSDAGMPALSAAMDVLEANGVSSDSLSLVQVPHHGSKRNVGPTVLDRMLGQKGQAVDARTAVVSCAKADDKKHPAKKVTNAFARRGCAVHITRGRGLCHSHNAPSRDGWSAATPVPLYSEVEDDA